MEGEGTGKEGRGGTKKEEKEVKGGEMKRKEKVTPYLRFCGLSAIAELLV